MFHTHDLGFIIFFIQHDMVGDLVRSAGVIQSGKSDAAQYPQLASADLHLLVRVADRIIFRTGIIRSIKRIVSAHILQQCYQILRHSVGPCNRTES